jgi:hypothetical protein
MSMYLATMSHMKSLDTTYSWKHSSEDAYINFLFAPSSLRLYVHIFCEARIVQHHNHDE